MSTTRKALHGIVQSFNVSPKGSYEGLILDCDGEPAQVNFPPEWSAAIAGIAAPGDAVRVGIEPAEAHGHPAHPVYRLLTIRNERKEALSLVESSGNGRFSGTIVRLNYALHGEVNGAILDSGDFLHVKPHGAVALGLEVGMKVKGAGPGKPMIGGHRVIEAEEVNGIAIQKKHAAKKHAAKKHGAKKHAHH